MIRSNHPNRYLIKKAKYSIISVKDYMASSGIFDKSKKQEMVQALDDFADQVENIEPLPINPAKIEETEALLTKATWITYCSSWSRGWLRY